MWSRAVLGDGGGRTDLRVRWSLSRRAHARTRTHSTGGTGYGLRLCLRRPRRLPPPDAEVTPRNTLSVGEGAGGKLWNSLCYFLQLLASLKLFQQRRLRKSQRLIDEPTSTCSLLARCEVFGSWRNEMLCPGRPHGRTLKTSRRVTSNKPVMRST